MSFLQFIPLIGKVLDRVLPDPAAAEAAKLEVLKLAASADKGQLDAAVALAAGQTEINKVEAASPSVFVAGWRPAIGWIGGFGLAYQFVLRPLLTWAGAILGWPVPPELDMGDLITIIGGMLGLGSLRTIEKINGVARVK